MARSSLYWGRNECNNARFTQTNYFTPSTHAATDEEISFFRNLVFEAAPVFSGTHERQLIYSSFISFYQREYMPAVSSIGKYPIRRLGTIIDKTRKNQTSSVSKNIGGFLLLPIKPI